MGCASSKGDINDQHPNIFQVMNVDEEFRPISPGQIEITDTDLIFHQRGKSPTIWSLRNLRKYGFDSEIFSFECGRRCATGPGIFAFKCRKAEQLFNLLQHNIQVRNMSEEVNADGANTTPGATTTSLAQMQRRSAPEGYLNPVSNNAGRPTLSRPGSITSNGPTSPTSMQTATPPLTHPEDNNNKSAATKRTSSIDHSYLNTEAIHMHAESTNPPQYINLSNGEPADGGNLKLYMNIDTTQAPAPPPPITTIQENSKEVDDGRIIEAVDLPQLPRVEENMHCYANINTHSFGDSAMMMSMEACDYAGDSLSVPQTPTEVNYVELDLIPSCKSNGSSVGVAVQTPDSPNKSKPYVTIDFKKTDALSYSINPRIDLEEGCRKTRHNSTIGDIRHSSSISD